MSEAIDQQGCFRHRANTRYFTFYEDFQDIGKGKHADKIAAFLRVLEVKTNKRIITYQVLAEEAKQNGQPLPKLSLWLEVSYNDFVSWSLHLLGRSSFQIADKEAERMLFCKSRIRHRPVRPSDPKSPLVEYKEYLLVVENVQAALDGQELPITGEKLEAYDGLILPPVEKNMPPSEVNTSPRVEKNMGHGKDNRYKSNSKESTSKENTKESLDADAPPQEPDRPSVSLSPEEQTFHDLFCQIETTPTISEICKKHYAILAPRVKTLDKVRSLHKFAKDRIAGPNKRVFPGNMVSNLAPWEEEEKAKGQATAPSHPEPVKYPNLERFEASVAAGQPIYAELTAEERRRLKLESKKIYARMEHEHMKQAVNS
jgi:hypothetical protein